MNSEKTFRGLVFTAHKTIDAESKERASSTMPPFWNNKQYVEFTAEGWIHHLEQGHTIQPSEYRPVDASDVQKAWESVSKARDEKQRQNRIKAAKNLANHIGFYRRAEDHWVSTHMILADADNIKGVDFGDNGNDLNPNGLEAWTEADGLLQRYPDLKETAYAVGESVSSVSKPPSHRRHRIAFLFDEPITSPAQYKYILGQLSDRYPIISCTKRSPAQPVFGNARQGHNEFTIFGNVLTLANYQMEQTTPEPEPVGVASENAEIPTEPEPTKSEKKTGKVYPVDLLEQDYDFARKCLQDWGYTHVKDSNGFECWTRPGGENGDVNVSVSFDTIVTVTHFSPNTEWEQDKAIPFGKLWKHHDCGGLSERDIQNKAYDLGYHGDWEQGKLQNAEQNEEPFMVKTKAEATGINHPVFPDDVFYGNFQYLYDAYLGKGSYVLDAPFVMAMGLSAVGVLSGKMRYIVAYEESKDILFPNMYSLIVGSSTYAAKSTTRKHLIRLIDNAFMDANVNNDVQLLTSVVSKAGLLEALDTEGDVDCFDGVTALLHFDELKAMFASMRRDYATDVQSLFNSLWECPIREQNTAKTNKIDAFYPVMNIFGCSTLEWLNAAVIQDDLGGGFMNRFMPFYSDGLEKYISKPDINKKSYNLFIHKLKALTDKPFNCRAEKYVLNDEAWQTWDNYAAQKYEAGKRQDNNTGTRRSPHHALKIALALHIITEPQQYKIGFECINTALSITEYLDAVGTFLYSEIVSTPSAKLEQRILSLLNRKNNSLPKPSIQNSLKDAGYREVGEAINGLIQNNILYVNKESGRIERQKIELQLR